MSHLTTHEPTLQYVFEYFYVDHAVVPDMAVATAITAENFS